MKYFQFSIFEIVLWFMKNEKRGWYIDEFHIELFRINDRALFSFYYETACASVLNVFFFRFEFFKKKD